MPIQTISPQKLHELRRNGSVDLIDVRTPAEYGEMHAEGARLAPLDRLDPQRVMAERSARPEEPCYVICRSGSRGAKACEAFQAAGHLNVVNVEGGTMAWEQAGLPVVRGDRKVISLERQVRIAAGALVLLGLVLAWLVHPGFQALSAFVGVGLVFAGMTDWCGMGMLLARLPWNQAPQKEHPAD